MKRKHNSQPSLRIGRFAVAVALAVSLAMSACAPTADPPDVSGFVADPAAMSDFEHALLDNATDPAARRPTFALTRDVPGEWTGGRLLKPGGRVEAFVATDDGPRAVVVDYDRPDRYAVFAPLDGTWQRSSNWAEGPLPKFKVSSYVGIGNDVIAVGPHDGGDKPSSFVVGADPAIGPQATDRTSRVTVHRAATGNGTVLAIGSLNDKATAWSSTDGIEWHEVSLPIEDSYRRDFVDLAFVDGRWIIVATRTAKQSDPQQLVVITGGDDGDWQQTTLEPPPTGVEHVILGHDGSNALVLAYRWSAGTTDYADRGLAVDEGFTWATEDGTTWSPPTPVATGTFGTLVAPLTRQSTFDATVLVGGTRDRSNYRYCFETDQPCQSTTFALWVPDGDTWSMLVPPAMPFPRAAIIDDVLYVGGAEGGQTTIYQWSPDASDLLPHGAPIETPAPPQMTLPPVTQESNERGVVYAASLPLELHDDRATIEDVCFDGRAWELSAVAPKAIDVIHELGAIADYILFGTIELIDRDRILIAIPEYGPIAYLEPRSTDEYGRPCSMALNL